MIWYTEMQKKQKQSNPEAVMLTALQRRNKMKPNDQSTPKEDEDEERKIEKPNVQITDRCRPRQGNEATPEPHSPFGQFRS